MLAHHWDVMEQRSAEFGNVADRRSWRLVSQIHVAETREQAYRDVAYGLDDYFEYFRKVAALPIVPEGGPDDLADQVNSMGAGVVGTPDDCIEMIETLIEQSNGGFGTLLVQAHEWANPAATHRSYELLAQKVLPHFQGSVAPPGRVEGLGGREPAHLHGRGRRRHHERHRQARRGAGGQGVRHRRRDRADRGWHRPGSIRRTTRPIIACGRAAADLACRRGAEGATAPESLRPTNRRRRQRWKAARRPPEGGRLTDGETRRLPSGAGPAKLSGPVTAGATAPAVPHAPARTSTRTAMPATAAR